MKFLVHLVGDIHQPLHCGCGYYEIHGHQAVLITAPDKAYRHQTDKGANVVVIHHIVDSGGEVFIIMELLPGGSLHDRLRERSKNARWFSAADGLRLIRDVLRGLEAAHSFEGGAINHRDLKPQNILFDRGGNAKIVDFGLAAVGEVGALTSADRAISFEHEGTWGYKSPEQLKGLELDRMSDLFNVEAAQAI